MKIITIDKTDDLHKVFKKYRKSSVYKFRGQSNSDWDLIPKAGRESFHKVKDFEIFKHWKRRGLNYLQNHSLSVWDYLVVAQHTGLPTRLLDWSHIPLTAAFFASNENYESDGAIWVIRPLKYLPDNKTDPFSLPIGRVKFYQPSAPLQRAANQFSYFSVHNNPQLELTIENADLGDEIEKIIIPKEIKKDLIFSLNQYGVNYLTIYPDLEGLSKHLCWFSENYEFWDNSIED